MKHSFSALGLLIVVSALLLSACGPSGAGGDQEVPARVRDARDAALEFVGEHYGQVVPLPDEAWQEENITPGWMEYRFTPQHGSGDWVITVGHAVLPADQIVYEVSINSRTRDFHWQGTVDTAGQVASAGQEPPAAVKAPDPARARDAAMAYLAAAYDEVGPAPDLAWTEKMTTPEGLVGASSFEYTSEGWDGLVSVSFPIVAPEHLVYQVEVSDPSTGFQWEGKVDATGRVIEKDGPQGGRDAAPEIGQAELAELVGGNIAFAFDLYQALRVDDGNLFYSPYSISLALAMTYAGARGETEEQMAATMHYTLAQDRLHPAFKALDHELVSRGEKAAERDGEGFRLNIANALWGQEGYPFLPEFPALLSDNYGAGLRLLDFAGDAEAARATINEWVEEQTEGRIKDLIPQGVVDAATRLVLTNAIYFNAAWQHPFEPAATEDGPFFLLNGGPVSVPMMRQTESFGYAASEGFEAIELPYAGQPLSMVILLPDEGEFAAFEESLDAERLAGTLEDLAYGQVALTLPKFEFESEFSLKETLAGMGMPAGFSAEADFSGMTGGRDLFISEVVHKAFIGVDEAGTEAAAATAVAMAEMAMPEQPVEITVDRPFLFFIRDMETGAILFLGRVVDPRA
jgi:serpin B